MTEPNILAFCCYWCSYTSADLAGVNRSGYPAGVRIQRYRCTGQISPDHILRAFEYGTDGVVVTGCRLGDCHYVSGNEKAKERLEHLQQLLDMLGIGGERLRMEWLSAAEGDRFALVMREFTKQIEELGPCYLHVPP